MPEVNALAVVVATIVAFLLSGTYYAVLGAQLAEVSDAAAMEGRQPGWTLGAELLRTLVLAAVVAGLASQAGVEGWTGGLILALVLWTGFPLVLWTGAVVHEKTPLKLAVIHAGDWLVKLPVVAVIVSLWQ